MDNTVIDYKKALEIFMANIKTIIICFLICAIIGLLFFLFLPRKYVSEAKILIKSSQATNLAYINPYSIQENQENNGTSSIFSLKNPIIEEIEIIKSPLVLDNVIKENNLRYKKGPAKGKLLSAKDFSRKNFFISKLKNIDVVYISYRSANPILAYNVVNSTINNYKQIEKEMNSEKALKDTKFLEKECIKAEKQLSLKINKLKNLKQQPENMANNQFSQNFNILGFYDKRFQKKLKDISNKETDLQKLETEIAQNTEELSSLKKKLSWSSMVNEISKNTTDIIILQQPEIKELYDYKEPNPLVILVFSLLSAVFLSFILINIKKY